MQHETALIAILAVGLGLAFVFGFLAVRLGLPPLVGYLLAGVAVGPFTPGFVADAGLASQLAEIGVILLMFGVGLHSARRRGELRPRVPTESKFDGVRARDFPQKEFQGEFGCPSDPGEGAQEGLVIARSLYSRP